MMKWEAVIFQSREKVMEKIVVPVVSKVFLGQLHKVHWDPMDRTRKDRKVSITTVSLHFKINTDEKIKE